jgi:hypothetical protein
MNHPYGEHIMYTDLIAGIALPLKLLSTLFPFILGNELVILNYSLLLSFVLQFVFLYKIGEYYGLNGWILFFGIMALGVISPQVARLYAHPGLAFVAVLPAAWWLYIKYKSSRKTRYGIQIFILIVFALFLHPYLGFIACSFLFLMTAMETISHKNMKQFLGFAFILLSPLLILNLFVKLSDFHTHRPVRYLDFIYYLADIKIFTAARSLPLFPFFEKINSFFPYEFEKENYFGFLCSVSLLIIFASFLLRKKYFIHLLQSGQNPLIHAFYSSFILALWAFGIPLVIFIDYLKPEFFAITQFRAVARFIWPMFYVISIVSLVFVSDGIRSNYKIRRFFSYAAFVLLLFEAFFIFEAYKFPQKNPFASLKIHDSPLLHKPDFIISIPSFCVGNGAFHKFPVNGNDKESYLASLSYGIPMMSSVLTRTSTTEALNQMSLFSCLSCPKPILKDINLKSNVFLILSKSEEFRPPAKFEKTFLNSTDSNQFSCYYGTFGDMFQITESNPQGFKNNYSDVNNPPVISLFNDTLLLNFRKSYFLKLLFAREELKMIADSIILPHANVLEHEVSYKHSNNAPYQTNLVFIVEEFGDDGSHNWISAVDVSAVADVQAGTSIVRTKFKCTKPNNYLRFFLVDYAKAPVNVKISDFQIRELPDPSFHCNSVLNKKRKEARKVSQSYL